MFRAVSIAAVAALGLAACVDHHHVLTRMERLTAEVGARTYGEAAGTDFVSCFSTDTNADGFITCTVKSKATAELTPLACNYREGSPGCKRLPPDGIEPPVSQ